jgi:type IVB pilus formation R64 PilN family outer membrane protein
MALPMAMLLNGCAGLPDRIAGAVRDADADAGRLVRRVGEVESAPDTALVAYENGLWLARNSIRLAHDVKLPQAFYEPATFERSVHSLAEFAERITNRSGIPVQVAPDAIAVSVSAMQPAGQSGKAAPQTGGTAAATQGMAAVRISYSDGSFKGLLDAVAIRFGVFWKYEDGAVLFYHTATRTFQINAIPGDSAVSASVASATNGASGAGGATGDAGGSGSSGSAAGGSQNTAVSSRLSVYSSMEKSIAAMLSSYGKVVASTATGSITVTDTPDVLARVGKYVDNENKALSRQVMINVTVLSVALSDGDSYGLNWNLVYRDLAHRFGIQNTFAADIGSSSVSAAVLQGGRAAGSSAMISALSSQGKVRRETTAAVAALNNQPVPVQVARQTSYLQSSQTTVTANVGSTTTLNPGTVTSGFNMTLLPHVLDNGSVMLQFSADMSNLRAIRTVSSNNSTIETPELDTRNFLQRIAMKSGETLVISGFEQIEDSLDRTGTGTPTNILLGGGAKAQSTKEVIVILVTPILMNGA